jgi:hypothetical protein
MSIRGAITLECDRKNCHAEQVFEGEDLDFDVRKERLFIEQCVDDWHMDEDGDLWCPQCLEEARQNADRAADSHERAAARARNNDFADTGGKDWT